MSSPPRVDAPVPAEDGSSSAPVDAAGATIEAEPDDYDDNDSAIATLGAHSTTSIGSSVLNYRKENGRRYHAYKDGKYAFPNDDEENDRLDLQHHIFLLTFDGKLFTTPIPRDKPLNRVLDVGTGTGIWAIDFADEHPESQVIGIDLSPIQPSFIPPNLVFEVDDLEEPWTFSSKFDFIHSRVMAASFANWPRFFEQSFENLVPGGYIEVIDLLFPATSADGTITADSPQRKWGELGNQSTAALGRPLDAVLHHKELMIAAGFENIQEVIYKWPSNRWPKDPKLKEIGMWVHQDFSGGLEGLSLAVLTRGLGWTKEEVIAFLVDVRRDMADTKVHAYTQLYVVTGQKPA